MRYDPREAYFNRLTPSARARLARISQHQFSDSIGGDSSNYQKIPAPRGTKNFKKGKHHGGNN